ncbi:MAG: MFS transporter [Actinobacteria bacterium]|nr:MFS transporter [Actinomycetota bacterium]
MSETAATPSTKALAEPTVRVPGIYLAGMALANLGIMLAFYTPIQNLLPRLSEQIAGADGKEVALAVVLGIGVIGSVIGNPLAGALSDRTTSRFGRRRPWMLGGALLGMVALFILPSMNTIIGLTILWLFIQFSVNASYAALTATIPDQVPVEQRGVASGWVGLAQTLGIVLGVALVSFVVLGLTSGTYLIAILFFLLVIPFMFILKDPKLDPADRPPFHLGAFVKGFWISPKQYPDFAWAWLARFLVALAISMSTLYLLFYLQDHLGFSSEEAGQKQTILIALYAFGTMLTAVVGGAISDRSGKRKKFVVTSTIIVALAALLLAFTREFNVAVIAAVILGLGYGWYLAVDQALITQVLPAAVDRARDLGVINIANSLPQVLAPVIAAPIVTTLGGYPVLYVVTAIVGLAGAVAVLPIKSVP